MTFKTCGWFFLNNLFRIFKVIFSSLRLETSTEHTGGEREVPECVIGKTATSDKTTAWRAIDPLPQSSPPYLSTTPHLASVERSPRLWDVRGQRRHCHVD